jgi:hypothetical protein
MSSKKRDHRERLFIQMQKNARTPAGLYMHGVLGFCGGSGGNVCFGDE